MLMKVEDYVGYDNGRNDKMFSRDRLDRNVNGFHGLPSGRIKAQDGMLGLLVRERTYNPHAVIYEDPHFIGDLGYRNDDVKIRAYIYSGIHSNGKKYLLIPFIDGNNKRRTSRGLNSKGLNDDLYKVIERYGYTGMLTKKTDVGGNYKDLKYVGSAKVQLPSSKVKISFLDKIFGMIGLSGLYDDDPKVKHAKNEIEHHNKLYRHYGEMSTRYSSTNPKLSRAYNRRAQMHKGWKMKWEKALNNYIKQKKRKESKKKMYEKKRRNLGLLIDDSTYNPHAVIYEDSNFIG